MSSSTWFFNSSLAQTYFHPSATGVTFRCPPPFGFGGERDYQLTTAQADALVSRIGRGYVGGTGATVVALLLGVALAVQVTDPEQIATQHPIAAIAAITIATALLIALCMAIVYTSAATVLAGLPWTPAPRAPYRLTKNLTKATVIATIIPTPLLVVFAAAGLIMLPGQLTMLGTALTSGAVGLELARLSALPVTVYFCWALAMKLKALRASR